MCLPFDTAPPATTMTKTLVALVLIAGGILLVTRSVDTDKSVPARLSPPTGADQISEARRVSPTMSARSVCNLIDPWQKCSFSKPKGFTYPSQLFADLAGRYNFLFETRTDYNHPRGQTMALWRHR